MLGTSRASRLFNGCKIHEQAHPITVGVDSTHLNTVWQLDQLSGELYTMTDQSFMLCYTISDWDHKPSTISSLIAHCRRLDFVVRTVWNYPHLIETGVHQLDMSVSIA